MTYRGHILGTPGHKTGESQRITTMLFRRSEHVRGFDQRAKWGSNPTEGTIVMCQDIRIAVNLH
jgi:hypothetical protein